jgi:hypothetical protein
MLAVKQSACSHLSCHFCSMAGASYWVIQVFLRSFSGSLAIVSHAMQIRLDARFMINITMSDGQYNCE